MAEYSIRKLRLADWQGYRTTRLRSLAESPNAFGSTYDREVALTDAQWQARLDPEQDTVGMPLGAFAGLQLVGLAWGRIDDDGNTAQVYQMWVDPAMRGRGVGRSLLLGLIRWCASEQVAQIQLGVTEGETPARMLYESLGFRPFGSLEPLREGSSLFIQNMQLTPVDPS